ncbi:hypothetical protein, partial [Paeniglutamicibacter kerguelensis]|uniref:hypothetical protein n=1 Tax=Paeniglutamicibacter kerguelensis TaxID=254788 RepID=UPI003606BDCA
MAGNRGDKIALAHPGSAGDTQLGRKRLQLCKLKAGKSAALGCVVFFHACIQAGGFGHEGSFPLVGRIASERSATFDCPLPASDAEKVEPCMDPVKANTSVDLAWDTSKD